MDERICSVEDCDRTRRRYGLCGLHSQRFVKYGATDLPERARPTCAGPDCDRLLDPIQHSSGLCKSHYKQQHLGKPLTPLLVATKDLGRPELCIVEGCGRPHKARGVCKAHNDRINAGKPLGPVAERLPPGPCAVEGCDRARFANGWCTRHNASRVTRWRMYGITPEIGSKMYADQDEACAICGTEALIDDLHVDHDHACCKRGSCGICVRGLLCQPCNIAIGYMRDDPERLMAAAAYLSR